VSALGSLSLLGRTEGALFLGCFGGVTEGKTACAAACNHPTQPLLPTLALQKTWGAGLLRSWKQNTAWFWVHPSRVGGAVAETRRTVNSRGIPTRATPPAPGTWTEGEPASPRRRLRARRAIADRRRCPCAALTCPVQLTGTTRRASERMKFRSNLVLSVSRSCSTNRDLHAANVQGIRYCYSSQLNG